MNNPIALSFLSVGVVSLVSLVGVVTIALSEKRLHRLLFVLVALSAGALFGDVFFHILPEIFSGESNLLSSLGLAVGVLIFFVLEKILRWHHHHDISDEDCPHQHSASSVKAPKHLGYLSLASDGIHNFIDGAIIGAAFLVGAPVGIATTLAVVLHEIPQEIGDFALLIYSGFGIKRALLLNLLSGLVAFLGLGFVLLVGRNPMVESLLLPLAAGGFLYIAGSDLVPELHKTRDPLKTALQFFALLLGVSLMAAFLWLD